MRQAGLVLGERRRQEGHLPARGQRCRHPQGGQAGQDYWLYESNSPGGRRLPEKEPHQNREAPEKADAEPLDRVYEALLGDLYLSRAHRRDLHRRGLSEAHIERGSYRTLPQAGREELARGLVYRFGSEVCSRVPGLYEKETGLWSVAGAPGMLVPVRNAEERIVALKVRADEIGAGSKYTYVSSKNRGGPGPGSQVHVPLRSGLDPSVVRLTEGELKADVATALDEILTVSAPGVSCWRLALPVLEALGATTVRLAFDADARENGHVSKALRDAFRTLEERGFAVELETWPPELGKGIDDVLAAGHEPEVLAGEEARAAVDGIAAEANGVSLILKNAVTAKDLLSMRFQEPRWIVPGILPEGATLLGGKPKMGKSWLALGIGVAVATGGIALGSAPVERGAVLYLALEDNLRRLQSRLKKLVPSGVAPEGLELSSRWPRLADGGLEALEAWLTSRPNAWLVVIDTLAKFRSGGSGRDVYKEDYEAVEPLVELAARHNVAVLVVHHLRKMAADDPLEQVSGSMGLTGGTDGAMVLNRERGRADAFLYVTGRDVEEEKEYALSWDSTSATWKIAGDAEAYRISKERQEVVEYLRDLGEPAGPKEVSEALGKPHNNVKQLMWKMDKDGDLRSIGGGKYVPVTDNPDNPSNRHEVSPPSEDPPESPTGDEARRDEAGIHLSEVTAVTEVTGVEPPATPSPGTTPARLLVTTAAQLEEALSAIEEARIVAVDLETEGLNPRIDRARLLTLATAEGTWLVDLYEVDPSPLFPVLAEKTLVMHNGAFDLAFLSSMGFELGDAGGVVDTMLTSQILEDKETA